MNSQPFDPFEPIEPLEPATDRMRSDARIPDPFFDRAGLAWIVTCVAIAAVAGHWIPRLSEPGLWRLAPRTANSVAMASDATQKEKARPAEAPAEPASPLQRGIF